MEASYGKNVGSENDLPGELGGVISASVGLAEPQPLAFGSSRQQPPGRPHDPEPLAARKAFASVSSVSGVLGPGVPLWPLLSAMTPFKSSVMNVRAASRIGL